MLMSCACEEKRSYARTGHRRLRMAENTESEAVSGYIAIVPFYETLMTFNDEASIGSM